MVGIERWFAGKGFCKKIFPAAKNYSLFAIGN
jgi:hypothetical protein